MANITMRDIGQRVGVSAVTVSKALAGRSGVGEEMRGRILRVAAELGYVNPNAAESRALDVGILVPDRFFSMNDFYGMLYKLLVKRLADAGHIGILEVLGEELEETLTLPRLMQNGRADALVLLGQPKKEYLHAITREKTPVVLLDFYDERACADAVAGDSLYGTYCLTCHLIQNGHRDIGFIGDIMLTSSIMDRYLGFYKAMLSHDLPIRAECVVRDRDRGGRLAPLALPARLPTAFVCNCDRVAVQLIEQLRTIGLRVPQDLSVVGFDDFSAECVPALSTFQIDREAMVDAAIDLLEKQIKGAPHRRVVIGGRPVYRDSEMALGE
ncbi:MAG: LacI family DNA-binding transcriptional regulator [Clostridia bacterium]